MRGKHLVLFLAMLAVVLTGSVAVCALAGGKTAFAATEQGHIEKTIRHTVPDIGRVSYAPASGARATIIGGFSGSYGTQLKSGSLERTIYDEMVAYYVKSRKTGGVKIPCKYKFSGSGEWEESEEYLEIEEDIEYVVETACSALMYDYPELFWIHGLSYSEDANISVDYKTETVFTGSITAINISFTEVYSGASEKQVEFSAAVAAAKSAIVSRRAGGTTYDLLKAIHDYVCETVVYPSGYDSGTSSSVIPRYHSAAGVFLDGGVAVCEGYAKSFMILCREFGIPAILVAGYAGEAHMWNYVQLQGSWYAVDTTWDDVAGAPADSTYFMIGSETVVPGGTFGTTRIMYTCFTESGIGKNFNYPVLNGTAYQKGSVHVHNWVVASETAPTCTEDGEIVSKCSSCGETTNSIVAALGHSYHDKKYVYNNDATVLSDGTKSLVCDNGCGTKKETVPAVGTKLKATIKLNVSSLKLKKGQSTKALKVSGLAKGDSVKSWETTDGRIVKVSKSGKITAQKKTGTAKIRVTLVSGLRKTVKVTVQDAEVVASKISDVARSITLKQGKMKKLAPVITPITCVQKLTYKSSNTKIVTVSASGKIKAKKKGKATITVRCGAKTAKCNIIVK